MVQQINHFFDNESLYKDSKIESYSLSDEVDYCLDGLTASKWDKEIEVKVNKEKLPMKVKGDLHSFRVALRTLLEFGIRYRKEN